MPPQRLRAGAEQRLPELPDDAGPAQLAERVVAAVGPDDRARGQLRSGAVVVGQTLSVSTGTWLNFPVTYTYQWERCDATGANCAPIPGATTQTYLITPNDVGFTLAAVVGATNVYGSGSATSAPTIVVPPEGPPPT